MVRHGGGRVRAAHPVISDSFFKSSSESKSEEVKNHSLVSECGLVLKYKFEQLHPAKND